MGEEMARGEGSGSAKGAGCSRAAAWLLREQTHRSLLLLLLFFFSPPPRPLPAPPPQQRRGSAPVLGRSRVRVPPPPAAGPEEGFSRCHVF